MTHTLTVYGSKVRVIVQTKDLSVKAASEVAAHFEKTLSQSILDAPHVGTMREHQVISRRDDDSPDEGLVTGAREIMEPEKQPAETPKKAEKKAEKKAPKKMRGFYRP